MKKKSTSKDKATESDNAYFLKILLYFIIGSIWVKVNGYMVFPLGLAIGLIFAQKDHFAIDRKIEYAILIVASLVGLLTAGLVIAIS